MDQNLNRVDRALSLVGKISFILMCILASILIYQLIKVCQEPSNIVYRGF